MAKKKKVKFYLGTTQSGSENVNIFITALRRKDAQTMSSTKVLRIKFSKVGAASTVTSIIDSLCEPKPKKLPHAKSVNLG